MRRVDIKRRWNRAFFPSGREVTAGAFMKQRGIKVDTLRYVREPLCRACAELESAGFKLDDWEYHELTWVGYQSTSLAVLVLQPQYPVSDLIAKASGLTLAKIAGMQTYPKGWRRGCSLGVIGLPTSVDLASELKLARYWLGENE